MKKIFSIFVVLLILTGAGCNNQQEESVETSVPTQTVTPQNISDQLPLTQNNEYHPEESALKENEYRTLEQDLNGDGEKEKISLTFKSAYSDIHTILHVDNLSVEVPGNNPSGHFGIVDIGKQDKFKEIAVTDNGPSTDFTTSFYFFDGKNLAFVGTIQGLYEDMHFDGKGKVTTKTRANILDTWFFDDEYALNQNHSLVNIPKDFYSRDTAVTLLIPTLSLQTSPTNTKISVTLKKGDEATVIGCDNKKWCEIKTKAGKTGWFAVGEYETIISANGTVGAEVFSGLSNAD